MKKFLLVLAVAGFVACNNKSEKKEGTGNDTTAAQQTSTQQPTVKDTSSKMAPDSTKK